MISTPEKSKMLIETTSPKTVWSTDFLFLPPLFLFCFLHAPLCVCTQLSLSEGFLSQLACGGEDLHPECNLATTSILRNVPQQDRRAQQFHDKCFGCLSSCCSRVASRGPIEAFLDAGWNVHHLLASLTSVKPPTCSGSLSASLAQDKPSQTAPRTQRGF